jgi:hygromycin-B 7''-O-kinase
MPSVKYSDRLGTISDEQLQAALDRFSLGAFVHAEPISQGLFGQNLFLTSDRGEYVLRGVPHYSWQFKTERFFAEHLHRATSVPVPWPYLLDESSDIFGWSYVIMPRLNGHQLTNANLDAYGDDALRQIAWAQGEMLVEAQNLTWPYPGRYDEGTDRIEPHGEPFFAWFKSDTLEPLCQAAAYNHKTTDADIAWVERVYAEAASCLVADFTPCFVQRDYQPGNMVVDRIGGRWQVTGIFDLMESSFGHGESDLSRLYCIYLEWGRDDLAQAFLDSYQAHKKDTEGWQARFPVFLLHDRAIVWEWAQRMNRGWWDPSLSFKGWVETFLP